MARAHQESRSIIQDCNSSASSEKTIWQSRYAEKHRLERIKDFPAGIHPPRRVRIYRRAGHYIVQWWDREEKQTVCERVDGDLLAVLSRARHIDERLDLRGSSGCRSRQISHVELVERFIADLEQRADASEIDVATVVRYRSALAHYVDFIQQPQIAKKFPQAGRADRDFQLAFLAFLNQAQISSNGHLNTTLRPMKGQGFVADVVRGMFQWAADPDRGKLLPEDFRNPFIGRKQRTNQVAKDPVCNPDITTTMAVDLIMSADRYQLAIFAPLVLYGLRPGELGWLFRESHDGQWLHVTCLPELDYMTKGRRNKQFPSVDGVSALWSPEDTLGDVGLLFLHRRVAEGCVTPPLRGKPLVSLAEEYRRRCKTSKFSSAAERRRIRDLLMREAGQLNYDHVEAEFGKLARQLNWPATATLKDLRHLFATSLENAGVPEYFRKYFMGQSFGKAPLVTYTHLMSDKIKQQYEKALTTEFSPLVDAIKSRMNELR